MLFRSVSEVTVLNETYGEDSEIRLAVSPQLLGKLIGDYPRNELCSVILCSANHK